MSEPTTVGEQEWTAYTVHAIAEAQASSGLEQRYEFIAIAHKAAIAAERISKEMWQETAKKLDKQLAAEREQARQAGEANIRTDEMLTSVRRERDEAQRQLAAERQKQKELEKVAYDVPLCADHAQTWFTARHFKKGDCWFCQQDNEIQQPREKLAVLVDVLTKARRHLSDTKFLKHEIDAALAKVKEGR